MLPYHLGALECLQYEKVLQTPPASSASASASASSPVAGSSAGAIAAMAYGCGLPQRRVLEATIQVSDQAAALGGARGRLLPLLQNQMNQLVGDEEFDYLMQSSQSQQETQEQYDAAYPSSITTTTTNIGIAYTEIFPKRRSILQTSFRDRQDLFQAVSGSCMFPFFATNFPCLWDRSSSSPSPLQPGNLMRSRLVVDGFFSVPRERFGCPDFEMAYMLPSTNTTSYGDDFDDSSATGCSSSSSQEEHPMKVDRTIAISVFPKSQIGMTAFADEDTISPSLSVLSTTSTTTNNKDDASSSSSSSSSALFSMPDLFRIATQATSRDDLTRVYELGYQNAEVWCRNEQKRQRQTDQKQRDEARKML